MQGHSEDESHQGSQDFQPQSRCFTRYPQTEPGHRRIERVAPRAQDAAYEEGTRDGLPGFVIIASRLVEGRESRVSVVDDVFHARETKGRERGVDDTVDDPIEFGSKENEYAENEKPFPEFLKDGSADDAADKSGADIAANESPCNSQEGIDGPGQTGGGEASPDESEQQRPPWLRIESVDDHGNEKVGNDGWEREACSYEHVVKVITDAAAGLFEQRSEREKE